MFSHLTDQGKPVYIIFLDFSEDFEIVLHHVLLYKIVIWWVNDWWVDLEGL